MGFVGFWYLAVLPTSRCDFGVQIASGRLWDLREEGPLGLLGSLVARQGASWNSIGGVEELPLSEFWLVYLRLTPCHAKPMYWISFNALKWAPQVLGSSWVLPRGLWSRARMFQHGVTKFLVACNESVAHPQRY